MKKFYHHHDNNKKMNKNMLNNLLQQRIIAAQNNLKGIAISSIPDVPSPNNKNIVVIPPGIGKQNLDHFKTMKNVTIAEGIDNDYVNNKTSVSKFHNTLETIKPTMIIAGSRGAELITSLLTKYPCIIDRSDGKSQIKDKIVLFGSVHLKKLFDAINNNKLTIVHGVLDDNEKIDNVRGLVSNRKNTHLIEATRQGHKLEFDKNVLNNVINYAY